MSSVVPELLGSAGAAAATPVSDTAAATEVLRAAAAAAAPVQSQAPARISVIMPLYNKAGFVEKAIRSALDNGPGVVEVIVVDDGSRDNGAEIVESIDDSRVRLVRKANGGVSTARNVGLDLATGDWLAFLDSDDYWLPGYIDAVQTMISRFPQCGMVTTRYQFEDDDGNRSSIDAPWSFDPDGEAAAAPTAPAPVVVDDFYGAMSLGHFCFTCSVVIRRDIVRREGLRFPVGEQMGEDLEVIFSAAEAAPVAIDARKLVVYRDGNQGVRLSRGRLDTLLLPFFQRLVQRLEAGQLPDTMRRGAETYLRSHMKYLLTYAARNNRRKEGFELLRNPLISRHPDTLIKGLVTLVLPDSLVTFLRSRLK